MKGLKSMDEGMASLWLPKRARIPGTTSTEEENSKAERVDRHVRVNAIDEWELTEVPRQCGGQDASG